MKKVLLGFTALLSMILVAFVVMPKAYANSNEWGLRKKTDATYSNYYVTYQNSNFIPIDDQDRTATPYIDFGSLGYKANKMNSFVVMLEFSYPGTSQQNETLFVYSKDLHNDIPNEVSNSEYPEGFYLDIVTGVNNSQYKVNLEIATKQNDYFIERTLSLNNNTANKWLGEMNVSVILGEYTIDRMIDRPAISGKDTIINNIDRPYTLDQIKQIAELRAIDAYYGDLTDDIKIVTDNYTANKSKVGQFTITYRVTNGSNLSTDYVLTVSNYDQTPPVAIGPSTSSISYKTTLSDADIIAKYTVSDNHDTDIKLVVESKNYVPGQVGTFTFNLKAQDKAGNITRVVHTANVFDDVAPVIADKHIDPIVLNWKTNYTNSDLLIDLTASDEIDGNLTPKIIIKTSNFVSGQIGTYQVVYEVADNAGNKFEHTRTYNVQTTDNPIFYVSKNMLLIEDVNAMTIDQIIGEMAKYERFDNVQSFSIKLDEYTGNETKNGTYNVSASLLLATGEQVELQRAVKVFTMQLETPEQPSEPWYQWMLDLWNHICNFFIWLANLFNQVVQWFNKDWQLLTYK